LFTRIGYDVSIWEEIRFKVQRKIGPLLRKIHEEIPRDLSLSQFRNKQPIPWQLRELMEQRATSWVQSMYDLCCDAYKDRGKSVSADFDRAVWAYDVEPFVMGEQQRAELHDPEMSTLLDLLLCSVGSTPEKRGALNVSQKDYCLAVRMNVYDAWYAKLHHQLSKFEEAAAVMAQVNAREARAARIAAGLPPEPLPVPQVTAAPAQIAPESPQVSPVAGTPVPVPSAPPPTADQEIASERNLPLPRKECDYSSLMDSAGLTELQRECYSLKHEYQLPVAEIARRLERDRKTIQEHIDAADNKVTLAANKERSQKRRARFGLE
jgi:hypothetical protein